MKYIKIYEDYTADGIDQLLGDLESVGQVNKVKVSCFVEGRVPQQKTHPSWWTEYMEVFAIVNMPDRGSEEGNKSAALKRIQNGDFDQKLEHEIPSILNMIDPEVIKIFSKENIQSISKRVLTLDNLLDEVKNQMVDITFKRWEEINEKPLSVMPEAELKAFYEAEWRSTPKRLKECISGNTNAKIRIVKVE